MISAQKKIIFRLVDGKTVIIVTDVSKPAF